MRHLQKTSSLLAKQLLRLDQKTVPLEDEQNLDELTTGGAVAVSYTHLTLPTIYSV